MQLLGFEIQCILSYELFFSDIPTRVVEIITFTVIIAENIKLFANNQ